MKQKQVVEITYENSNIRLNRSWLHRVWRRIFRVNRKHKDRLFIKLFSDPKLLLQLYNALNHSDYTDPEELLITTLEDAVYMSMKDDCAFLVGDYLNLYEHQSTYNPNMPLRGFLYFASLIQGFLAVNQLNVFGKKRIKIPTPQYLVFYNGEDTYPDEMEMRLSDSFTHSDGCMEFTARMININLGHNQELMEQCKVLEEYATFVNKIREFQSQGFDPEESIDLACAYCIEHDILKEFLLKNRNEVRALILTEYDEKKHMDQVREEGFEAGMEKGVAKGIEKGIETGMAKGMKRGILYLVKSGDISKETAAKHLNISLDEVEKLLEELE